MATLQESANSILNEKQTKIIPENIKAGVTIFGVTGTATGESNYHVSDVSISILGEPVGKTSVIGAHNFTEEVKEGDFIQFTNYEYIQDEGSTYGTALAKVTQVTENDIYVEIINFVEDGLDTSDATASKTDIVKGKTAYIKGEKVTGTMNENTGIGFMDGSEGYWTVETTDYYVKPSCKANSRMLLGKGCNVTMYVPIAQVAESAGVTPDKIVEGATILGVEGAGSTTDRIPVVSSYVELADIQDTTKPAVVIKPEAYTEPTTTLGPTVAFKASMTLESTDQLVDVSLSAGTETESYWINISPFDSYIIVDISAPNELGLQLSYDLVDGLTYEETRNGGETIIDLTTFDLSVLSETELSLVKLMMASFSKEDTKIYEHNGTQWVLAPGQLNTDDATATADYIGSGKTAYVKGQKITGTANTITGTYSPEVWSCFDEDENYIRAYAGSIDGSMLLANNAEIAPLIEKSMLAESIELTEDKIVAGNTILGIQGTGVAGEGLDTSDADATPEDILSGKTAYVNGEKIEGIVEPLYDIHSNAENIDVSSAPLVQITGPVYDNGIITDEATVHMDLAESEIAEAVGLTSDKITSGTTVLGITGTAETLDTSDATAVATDIRQDKTAYIKGKKVVGTMTTYASKTVTPTAEDQTLTEGYYTNLTIKGDTELVPDNIRKGVSIFNILGTYEVTGDTEVEVSSDTLVWQLENDHISGSTTISTPEEYVEDMGQISYDYADYNPQQSLCHWFSRLDYNPEVEYESETKPRVNDIIVGVLPRTFSGYKFYAVSKVTSIEASGSAQYPKSTIYIDVLAYTKQFKTLAEMTQSADATPATIFEGKKAYVKGELITGTYNAAAAGDTTFYLPASVSFAGSKDLTSIDFTGVGTGTTSNWADAFSGCQNLTTVNYDSWDVSGATNMSNLFNYCTNLDTDALWASNFKVGPTVTSINMMFNYCSNMKTINIPATWNLSGVTQANSLFQGCQNLTSADLTNMDLSNAINCPLMFANCNNLTSVTFSNIYSIGAPNSNIGFMFAGCSKMNFASLNFSVPNNGKAGWLAARLYNYGTYTIDLGNINFTGAANVEHMGGDCYGNFHLNLNFRDMPYMKSLYWIFANLTNCSKLTGISELNAPNCTGYTWLWSGFNRATKLTELNMCNWRLPNLNKLSTFFDVALPSRLANLDMCNWYVPNVTTTYKMFNSAPGLVNLNVQNMSLPLLTNAQSMFNCPNLSNESLDQILNLMTVTSLDGSSKTLAYIGLKADQAAICETLPNWTNLQAAGWTTGY